MGSHSPRSHADLIEQGVRHSPDLHGALVVGDGTPVALILDALAHGFDKADVLEALDGVAPDDFAAAAAVAHTLCTMVDVASASRKRVSGQFSDADWEDVLDDLSDVSDFELRLRIVEAQRRPRREVVASFNDLFNTRDAQTGSGAVVAAGVEIDLDRCSGRPVLEGTRLPVHRLLSRVVTTDAVAELARDFAVSEQGVRDGFAYAEKVFYKAAAARTRKLRHQRSKASQTTYVVAPDDQTDPGGSS